MRFTIFTPTYNRGYIINKLFVSLKKQTFKDFEWIVIDDGSTDQTESIVSEFIKDSEFPIIYKKVENGGKHRAVNLGTQIASGELFFIVDSDDWLPEQSLQIIDQWEKALPNEGAGKFCGICGLRVTNAGIPMGTTFIGQYLDCTTLERGKNGISGDKAEVIYTDIIRQYPFEEFEGEKFLTESVMWDKIANAGYKFRFINENVYVSDYLDDGLSKSGMSKVINSPKGWGLSIYQDYVFGKISNDDIWNKYLTYYYMLKGKIPFTDIPHNLHISAIPFYALLFLKLINLRWTRRIDALTSYIVKKERIRF